MVPQIHAILESCLRSGEYTWPEQLGKLPKRPKGSDCKSAGVAFGGSNPSLATKWNHSPN